MTFFKKMILLEVKKPDLFYFHPGQYVYLKIPNIDDIWHPFSVASSPGSDQVVFYIEVFGEKSWTYKLYERLLHSNDLSSDTSIEIMGP